MAQTHSGSMCINDAVIQACVNDLPYGGIGKYHGHKGFPSISMTKSVKRNGKL
jgi:coniferyl-aldehyde dehydrogenase